MLQDSVAEGGDEEVERELGDGDDRAVELPFGLGGVVGELDLEGDGEGLGGWKRRSKGK